jgi:VWFA-related protein
MRFEDGMVATSRREAFRYVIKAASERRVPEQFEEYRVDAITRGRVTPPPHSDFLVIAHFLRGLNYLLPDYQGQSRFRYLGRGKGDGQDCFVLAFAKVPEGTGLRSHGQAAGLQGIAWIDAATKRIVGLRMDLLGPVEGLPLETITTNVSLVPVNFSSIGGELWLPARVTVHARYAGGDLHTVYRYSDYQSETDKSAGIPAVAAASGEDAYELLTRGVTLTREAKAGEGIAPLREAVRLNPDMPAARFFLADALRTTGDLAGAEGELREAAKLAPDSGPVHNLRGIVLSKRGDEPGAVAEFRKSAEIQPKLAIVHFNLGQALERSGDRTAALEEYRTASDLAPDNAGFKTRYEQLAHAANSPMASESTIKVEVRQVLVPVIVTDKEGHHVTGLTRADFQVFEDGVEQTISSFSVEDAGLTASGATASMPPAAEPATGQAALAPATPEPTAVRRTYVICIDSLHAALGNLVYVRQALSKLFRSEQPGDSQYVVLAIGSSTQLVQDTTSDPGKAIQAIESKDFRKVFLASQKNSLQAEMLAFRRTLDEVRSDCDAGRPECARKSQLPPMANQIASEDRAYAISFLSQFQALVKNLSRGTGRRVIVFISDGFQLVPGKQAFELLASYFPGLGTSLGTVDRMQELEPVLRLAANSNIPVYTIDSRGLYTSPSFDVSDPGAPPRLMPAVSGIMNSDASEAGGTLSEIAAATGGTAFQNSNDILTGLQRAFADGREYYMLAYVPGNSNADGKFHAISVRLRDKNAVVRAKRGYWAVPN